MSTTEAVMKYHFFPRKSKFVFLNISMRHAARVLTGLDTGHLMKVPDRS
jgi:hypothetical protein